MDVDGLAAVLLLPDGQPLMGTFAPAWSQPSGQEFLCLNPGLVVFWRLAMALAPQRESWGTAPLARRAAGGRRRNPTTGAPPDGH